MKEVENHIKHLEVTFDRLLNSIFTDEEIRSILTLKKEGIPIFSQKSAWIKTSDLVLEGITTEKMALIHLLWFQSIGRIVIEDIDPFSGAVLIHLSFKDVEKDMERRNRS